MNVMSERIKARVSLLFGDQALLDTTGTAGGEPERVPVDRLVSDTGIPRGELAGARVVAVVSDSGEVERFERE